MKKILTVLLILILLVVLAGGTCCFLFCYLNAPTEILKAETYFEIYSGETGADAGQRLKDAGLIKSSALFYLIARYSAGTIKAGYYTIPAETTSVGIYDILTSGQQEYIRLTVPEGLTVSKIAALLEENRITFAQDFIRESRNPQLLQQYGIPGKSAEGYLFPDTYFFCKNAPADDVLKTFLDQFFTEVQKLSPEIMQSPDKLYNTVILASIIEREYRDPAEIRKIAGVFSNRLKIGMGLQSCATIVYITTELQGKPHTGFVTLEDTRINSPYNTYLWAGLPPGPISNPGRLSLQAALQPERHGYLYFFLVDENRGTHFFSRTLDEHAHARRLSVKR